MDSQLSPKSSSVWCGEEVGDCSFLFLFPFIYFIILFYTLASYVLRRHSTSERQPQPQEFASDNAGVMAAAPKPCLHEWRPCSLAKGKLRLSSFFYVPRLFLIKMKEIYHHIREQTGSGPLKTADSQ